MEKVFKYKNLILCKVNHNIVIILEKPKRAKQQTLIAN